MAKENKVEYERVDKEGDDYKRVLVKFNSRFLRGPEFTIEFIPLEKAITLGRIFVREIDSVSTIDLYQWNARQTYLMFGSSKTERGTLLTKGESEVTAEYLTERWREREIKLEPREVIGRVKLLYEAVENGFGKATASAFNYFLYSGELGSLPYDNEYFSIEKLKSMIEETPYYCKNARGVVVKLPLVDNLFDTHKTEHITGAINNFLLAMCRLREEILEEHNEDLEEFK